jgi:hypothetical protein
MPVLRRPSSAPRSRRETATGHLVAREPAAPVPVLLRPRGRPTHVAGSSLPPLSTQSRLSPAPRREPSSRRTRRASLYAMMLAARDSNPNRQIRSLVLCVDLVGSRRILAAHVGCLVGPDGSRRIQTDRLHDHRDDQARSIRSKGPWSGPSAEGSASVTGTRQAHRQIEAPRLTVRRARVRLPHAGPVFRSDAVGRHPLRAARQ